MIAGLVASLVARGLPAPAAKAVLAIGGMLLAAVLLLGAKALYDRSVVNAHDAKREAASADNREQSSNERAADTVELDASRKGLEDAIDKAPPTGEVSPAARALACERLRRVGRAPPACGSAGGDGT